MHFVWAHSPLVHWPLLIEIWNQLTTWSSNFVPRLLPLWTKLIGWACQQREWDTKFDSIRFQRYVNKCLFHWLQNSKQKCILPTKTIYIIKSNWKTVDSVRVLHFSAAIYRGISFNHSIFAPSRATHPRNIYACVSANIHSLFGCLFRWLMHALSNMHKDWHLDDGPIKWKINK